MSITLNTGITDLSTAYTDKHYELGTKYIDDDGGIYVWGKYVDASVTVQADRVCVPVLSSTNSVLFTADITDTDADMQSAVGYAPAKMSNGKMGWFKTGGFHKVKQCSAVSYAKGTMFRTVGTDQTVSSCSTFVLAAGITLEKFGTSATTYRKVHLFSTRRP